MSEPSLNVWIARIDGLRQRDALFARGRWRGYKDQYDSQGAGPMRGEFFLVRTAQPTVAVSHEDPDEAIRLARTIEITLGNEQERIVQDESGSP